jgi:hypothetical protein
MFIMAKASATTLCARWDSAEFRLRLQRYLSQTMGDPADDEQRGDGQAEAAQALVREQLRAARTEVFRAYLQAREQARALVEDEHREAGRHGPTSS